MSMPFYVSPEQLMKDRADFARKGIARGRSLVVVQYADGIVFVSENLSQALHKVSEIYDRIAFAAVGRYNEFENLRIAGVRLADMRGYAYDRRDVTGRGLANAYAQTLGTIFSSGGEKPYEVELFVAEVGDTVEDDSIYRLTYDGQVADEHGYAVMGGLAEPATTYLKEHYETGAALDDAIRTAVQALGQGETETRAIPSTNLEVAVLDRTRTQQRKFKRLTAGQLGGILGNGGGPVSPTRARPRRRCRHPRRRHRPLGPRRPGRPHRHRHRRPAPRGPRHRRAQRPTRRTPAAWPSAPVVAEPVETRRGACGIGHLIRRPPRVVEPSVEHPGRPSRHASGSRRGGRRGPTPSAGTGWASGSTAVRGCRRPAGRPRRLAADPAGLRVLDAPDRGRAARTVAAAAARRACRCSSAWPRSRPVPSDPSSWSCGTPSRSARCAATGWSWPRPARCC